MLFRSIAVIVTLYSNPFTVVPLYYFAFKLGQLALMDNSATMPDFAFGLEGKGFTEWLPTALHWLTSIGKPLLVGLPLLALLLSVLGYVFVRVTWRCYVVQTWRRRKLRHERNA